MHRVLLFLFLWISQSTAIVRQIGLAPGLDFIKSETFQVPDDVTVQFVDISITASTTFSGIQQAADDLKRKNLNLIVYQCQPDIFDILSSSEIMTIIVGETSCDKYRSPSSNVLVVTPSIETIFSMTKVLVEFERFQRLIIFHDDSIYASQLIRQFDGSIFFSVGLEETDSLQLLVDKLVNGQMHRDLYGKQITANLCILSPGREELLLRFLEAALLTSNLKEDESWIFPGFDSFMGVLEKFRKTKVRILTAHPLFGSITSVNQTWRRMAIGAVDHALHAWTNETVGLPQLLKSYSHVTRYQRIEYTASGTLANQTVAFQLLKVDGTDENIYLGNKDSGIYVGTNISPNNFWRIATIPNSLYYTGNATTTTTANGIAVDAMTEIRAISSSISFVFVFPSEPNPTTTDLLNMLRRKEADIVMYSVVEEGTSLNEFETTNSFSETGVNMLYRIQKRELLSRLLWHLTVPFNSNVWILIVASYLLLSFVMWSTDKLSGGRPQFTWGESCFVVFGSFVMSKIELHPRIFSVRIFASLLYCATLIVVASYTALLFQYLYMRPGINPIKSFQDLYDSSVFRFFFKSNVLDIFEREYINSGTAQIFGKLYVKGSQTWGASMLLNDTDSEVDLIRNNSNYVFIGDVMENTYISNTNCELRMTGQTMALRKLVLPIRKNWIGTTNSYSLLNTIINDGTFKSIYKRYYGVNVCDSTAYEWHSINWTDVFGLFGVLGGGCILGFIAAIIELCYKKCCLCIQRRASGGLEFKKFYKAKVTLMDSDGIWIRLNGHPKELYYMKMADLTPGTIKTTMKISPVDLGIKCRDAIKVQFLGNDPKNARRIFHLKT